MNPVREIAAAAHRRGAAVIVDAVCSFAGAPLETDAWGLDVVVGRNPEVPRLPVRARARHLLGRGRRADGPAPEPHPLELPRPHPARPLLEPGAPEPPYRPDHDGLRAPGSAPDRAGGGPRRRGSRGTGPRARRWRPGCRALGLELYGQPPGPAKMPMLAPVRRPRRRRRRGVPRAAPRGARGRDHGRVRPPRRPHLADRHDGGQRASPRASARTLGAAGRRARDRAPAKALPTRSARRAGASTRPRGPPPAPDLAPGVAGPGRLRTRRGASGRGSRAASRRCG